MRYNGGMIYKTYSANIKIVRYNKDGFKCFIDNYLLYDVNMSTFKKIQKGNKDSIIINITNDLYQ